MLIAKGADPHALDSENRTPFTCVLSAMHIGNQSWFDYDLCDAVMQWGQYIQDAGVSLHAYVATENSLQSRLGSAALNLRVWWRGNPWNCRLVVTGTLTLAIEVGFSVSRPLWQYSPPPGAWRKERYQLLKIGWLPESYFEGDSCILWQQAENLSIALQPELIRPYEILWFEEWATCAWRAWTTGVQDDHGFVSMTLQQSPGMSRKRGRERRAASLPPPITKLDGNHRSPDGHCSISQVIADPWMSDPHRCPLDLTWKSTYRATNGDRASRRRCMLGRCDDGEPDLRFSRHWEIKLLEDEKNFEIARRFTDRFRPEWRYIVEENHKRAQRRAELGMFPT